MDEKTKTVLENIYEDLHNLFHSDPDDLQSFYQYLEQIKEILVRQSKREFQIQQKLVKQRQKLAKQKQRMKNRIRKEREVDDYLFSSRYSCL